MAHVQFASRGRQVVAKRQSGETQIWELHRDSRAAEDLVSLAQMLAGHENLETSVALVTTERTLCDIWRNLRDHYPEDFATSEKANLDWHNREAEAAESTNQWSAALFHINRMLEGKREDRALVERARRARSALAKSND
ncbi:MAG: hypothetical protein FJ403_19580 [Verrucomicrobia bacterium]|nr:hypothetical protein [Verrucomicrobiota bacterium]